MARKLFSRWFFRFVLTSAPYMRTVHAVHMYDKRS